MVENTPITRTTSGDVLPETVLTLHRSQVSPPGVSVPELRTGQVHVWTTQLELSEDLTSDYADLLTPDESARAARFYFERHQNRYVVGRGVLRTLLGAYLHVAPETVRFAYGPQGKPELSHNFPNTDLCFNVAHCEGFALVAVTRAASVGVDVERVRRLPEFNELVNRFFSPREAELFAKLSDNERPQAFFNLWTRKEAWLKATGDGIASLLSEVNVSFLQDEPARLLSLPRRMNTSPRSRAAHCLTLHSWSLCDLRPAPGFTGAVAVATSNVIVHCFNWQHEHHNMDAAREVA
jgi:4'-phosphopantetheinyl transferase